MRVYFYESIRVEQFLVPGARAAVTRLMGGSSHWFSQLIQVQWQVDANRDKSSNTPLWFSCVMDIHNYGRIFLWSESIAGSYCLFHIENFHSRLCPIFYLVIIVKFISNNLFTFERFPGCLHRQRASELMVHFTFLHFTFSPPLCMVFSVF